MSEDFLSKLPPLKVPMPEVKPIRYTNADITIHGRVNGMDELDPEGSYIAFTITGRHTGSKIRAKMSIPATNSFVDELLGLLQTQKLRV